MIRHAALACLILAAPAGAAQRQWLLTSFDHVRVVGPFQVKVVPGSPRARAQGDALDGIDVHQNGNTVVVQASVERWSERPRGGAGAPVVIELTTPTLVGGTVTGPGQLTIAAIRGPAMALRVAGAGTIDASGIAAEKVDAALIGTGRITLAGRTTDAVLTTSGTGTIDAAALDAGTLAIRLDGPGETHAAARFTARIVSTGTGTITVDGHATCQVSAPAGGTVRCGDGRAPSPGQ